MTKSHLWPPSHQEQKNADLIFAYEAILYEAILLKKFLLRSLYLASFVLTLSMCLVAAPSIPSLTQIFIRWCWEALLSQTNAPFALLHKGVADKTQAPIALVSSLLLCDCACPLWIAQLQSFVVSYNFCFCPSRSTFNQLPCSINLISEMSLMSVYFSISTATALY